MDHASSGRRASGAEADRLFAGEPPCEPGREGDGAMMLARLSGSFLAQIAGLAISFADRFVVVGLMLRLLGASAFADWTLLVSAAGLVTLAELGLNIYWGNEFQRAEALGDRAAFARLVRIALGLALQMGAVLALAVAATLTALDPVARLSLRTVGAGEARLVLLLLAAAVISRIMRGSISQVYRGRGKFAMLLLVDQAAAATLTVSLAIAAAGSGRLVVLAGVYLAVDVVAGWGLMLRDLKRRFPDLRFAPQRPSADDYRHLLTRVRWFAIQQGAPVVWLHAPVLMLGALGIGGADLFRFTLLRTLTNFARQVGTMAALSAGVELASIYHAGDRERFATQLGAFSRMVAGLAGVIAAGLFIFAQPLVTVWTGDAGLFDATILACFVVALLAVAPATLLNAALMYCNHPRPAAIANLAQIGLGLLAALLLIRVRGGGAGAAAGLALGDIVGIGVVLPVLGIRALGIGFGRHMLRSVAAMLGSAAWGAACGVAVTALIAPTTALRLALAGGVWGSLMIPALLAAMTATHRARLMGVFASAAARLRKR